MDTTVIVQQCNLLLNESNSTIKTDDQLNKFFEIVTNELTKNTSIITQIDVVIKIVTSLASIDKKQLCKHSQLNNHKLLLILLRDYFIKFLFNQNETIIINNLSMIFHQICYGCNITDDIIQLFINQSLIGQICLFFNDIEKYTNEPKLIETIDRLIKIYQRIQMFRFDLQTNENFEALCITIAKCMSSNYFINKLKALSKAVLELNPIEILLFDTCIEFMYWQSYETNQVERKHLSIVCDSLLQTTVNLMSSSLVSEPLIRLACFLSLNLMIENTNLLDENTIDDNYYRLVDYSISMLDYDISINTKRTLLSTLCHCSYPVDMIIYMRNNLVLKSILLKLCESDDAEISLNSYRILAIIMSEDDIKRLENGSKIVSLFYIYIISMIDDPIQKTAFQSLLHSLKYLVQHEQIKIELIKQETIPLLSRCVIEKDFHKTKIQLYALEILLALSFNNEALDILEKDTNLMNYVKMLENSKDENLQRAANHLLWQFTQKINSHSLVESNSSNANKKFDIMLSYSHVDKKLCFEIYEKLTKDEFRVWLDRDQMHGDTMTAMADAIENSEFVLICMSESYKQSPYCQAEAHYAFQRGCKLIPIVMKAKYKADGWLGIIVSGKIYVDFTKFQLDSAYSMLKSEIQKKRLTSIEKYKPNDTISQLVLPPLLSKTVNQDALIIDFPRCIDTWSETHVRSFLIQNNFASLLPIFPGFNGRLLHQAYSMCESSRESMFQAMRNEVIADGTVPPLTIATYLNFLDRLKVYIPINAKDRPHEQISAVCNIM